MEELVLKLIQQVQDLNEEVWKQRIMNKEECFRRMLEERDRLIDTKCDIIEKLTNDNINLKARLIGTKKEL